MSKILLDKHYLLMDCSGADVQVGILHNGWFVAFFKEEQTALEALFKGVEVCLADAGMKLADLAGVIYCEGPGSLLGVRLGCMAINAWRKLKDTMHFEAYSYNGFELAKKLVKGERGYVILAQAGRRRSLVLKGEKPIAEVEEVKNEELVKFSDIYVLHNKYFGEEAFEYREVEYDLRKMPEVFYEEGFLKEKEFCDAYFFKEPVFQEWKGERHR